jgi:hypothetical protein
MKISFNEDKELLIESSLLTHLILKIFSMLAHLQIVEEAAALHFPSHLDKP